MVRIFIVNTNTTIKQNKGMKYPFCILPVLSEIMPNIGGSNAPPTIDIMIKLEAGLVAFPKPFIPKAKMVGNIIDIKNAIPINEYMVIIPLPYIAMNERRIFIAAYRPNNFTGSIYFIKKVPAKRPIINAAP